uniref:Uncharacterized protein n=1 Tax=viral metagenome TaxID=1070528 RepID=A0A6C0HXW2_9ZZZZ
MEDIRDEDRGKETMVFEITSISLNAVLQFCVGNSYEHKGKDRYNVYLVKNGKVHGCVGHYDVESGEETTDSGGKDFDVKKYQEPEWLIEPTSSLLTREVEREKPAAKEKPPKHAEVKSIFRVITTSTEGDCFYDSVVRADKDGYDEEKIHEFKERLGDFMTKGANKDNLIAKYKAIVELKGAKTQTLIEDPYYRKYCEMRNAGTSDEDIVVQMRKDIEANPELEKKLSPDDFELLANDDESPNKPTLTEDVSALSNEYIHYFFNDDKTLEGDDIIDTFLENFMKKDTWADAFIISQAALFLNVIFLLLVEKKGRVEDYEIFNMQAQLEHPIDKDTQFILASYQPQKHFKLIVQDPYIGKFTIDTLPQVIKDKFPLFKSGAEPPATGAEEAPAYEPVAVDVPKIPDVVDKKYTAETLKGKTMKELEDILKAEFPDVPQSRVKKENGKQGLIDCILNPEDEKCKKLTKKKATGGKFTRRV